MAAALRDFFSPDSDLQVYTSVRTPPAGNRASIQWLQARGIKLTAMALVAAVAMSLNSNAHAQDLTQSAPKLYAAAKPVSAAQRSALADSIRMQNDRTSVVQQRASSASGNVAVSLETGIAKAATKASEPKPEKPRSRGPSQFTPGMG